jgi:hypothetical protein
MDLVDLMVWAQGQVGPRGMPPRGGGTGAAPTVIFGLLCCYGLFILAVTVPTIAGMWKAFSKAGEPGWASIVPIYNVMVMAKIAGRGEVYGLLTLIPIAGVIFLIIILIDFCDKFGQGPGFAIGLALLGPIFWPILGFGSSRYEGARPRRRAYEDEYGDEYEDEPRPRRRRYDDDDEGDPRIRRRDGDYY